MGGPAGNPGGLRSVDPPVPNVSLPSSTMSLPPIPPPVAVSWDRYEGVVTRRSKLSLVLRKARRCPKRLQRERLQAWKSEVHPKRLPFEHDEIVALAVAELRPRYHCHPDPDGLMGDRFTLLEPCRLNEAIHGRELQRDPPVR